MTAGARFSLFALLAVVVIGWGLVATTPTPGRRPPSSATQPAPDPAPDPDPDPGPAAANPSERSPTAAAPKPPAPTPPAALAGPRLEAQADPSRDQDPAQHDPVAEAYANRERVIERNVVRYDAARERFGEEPRDPAWAPERERALQAVADESGIGDLVESVECRTSLCQLRMRFNGLTAAGAAVRLAPLANAIGRDRVLRNEGPPDQRTMVIYLPRDGQWPDAPREVPALDGK